MDLLRAKGLRCAAALLLALGGAPAGATQLSLTIAVNVKFIATSGPCAAVQAEFGFDVVCERPVVLPAQVGAAPHPMLFPRAGDETPPGKLLPEHETPADASLMPTALPYVESTASYNGVEISSWRRVSLHNGASVELTIAW